MFNTDVKLSLRDFNEILLLQVHCKAYRDVMRLRNANLQGLVSHVQTRRTTTINGVDLAYVTIGRSRRSLYTV